MGANSVTSKVKAIRIAVADSNQMACRLLSEALGREPGFSVVASVVDDESLLRSMQALQPDIAVVSAALRGGPLNRQSGFHEFLNRAPQCPWILLLDQTEPELVIAAFRCRSERSILARSVGHRTVGEVYSKGNGRADLGRQQADALPS